MLRNSAASKPIARSFATLVDMKYLLGVEIRRRLGGGYFLVQEKYALEVVRKFRMGEAKVASMLGPL